MANRRVLGHLEDIRPERARDDNVWVEPDHDAVEHRGVGDPSALLMVDAECCIDAKHCSAIEP